MRFSWNKDSNLASLVREATVRIFSMASVAICGDTPHKHYSWSQGWYLSVQKKKKEAESTPFQPSPAPSCLRQHVRWASSSPKLQPALWRAPQPRWEGSAPSHTRRPVSHRCPGWQSSGQVLPNVLLRPEQEVKVRTKKVTHHIHFQLFLFLVVCVCVTAAETYPLHLGSICGQSCSERSDAVFGVIKPAKILQQQCNINN